ncbi:histidine kinase/DNA gyrase B/HSP90-like ATPase [Kineococcus xinjiangensis]|uniref:Oxygen sensor histidine kinase NreB n=1 Tax=Kineococcus xinjiangensis TaxID=512762 RepID=A0A2S6IDA8_9ACTN|nr:histidine kinase/DNA gyrase B/HSP90-like ATPase [Kineococcus xinjiangensis]
MRLRGRHVGGPAALAVLAVLAAAVSVVCALTGAGLTLASDVPRTAEDTSLLANVVAAVVPCVAGALLARDRRARVLAVLLLVSGSAMALSLLVGAFGEFALLRGWDGAAWAVWPGQWLWVLSVLPNVTLLPLLFPDGRPPSRRWRPVLGLTVAAVLLFAAVAALQPGPLDLSPALRRHVGDDTADAVVNPVGVDAAWLPLLSDAVSAAVLLAVVLCVLSLPVRWWSARGPVRSQLLCLMAAYAGVVLIDQVAPRLPAGADQLLFALSPVLPVAAIWVAVRRHGAYDLRLGVRRTTVFALVTGIVFAVYATVVTLFVGVLGARSLEAALLASVVVVAVVEPARRWVQRAVSRWLFGDRDDPLAALSRLRRDLDALPGDDDGLHSVAAAIAAALRAPHVALTLPGGAAVGVGEPGGGFLEVPLIHRGEEVGTLRVGTRGPVDAYGRRDRILLEELARVAAAAAHAARLARELARAQERSLRVGAEERRTLRRDLHDGLGPLLAGATLALEGMRLARPAGDPAAAALARVGAQVRVAGAEVRRILDGLRPGPVDDLGLVEALRQHVAACRLPDSTPDLRVVVDGDLPRLPAAVEDAAYGIALEALTNAVRHAGASRCTLVLRADEELHLEVRDDGCGAPADFRAGVGLSSMRERARALGGSLRLIPAPGGGTLVRVALPLAERTADPASGIPS